MIRENEIKKEEGKSNYGRKIHNLAFGVMDRVLKKL